MATMGKYCKAYPLRRLREYNGWSEKVDNARKENKLIGGKEIESPRVLTDDAYVYLQENYVVTDDVFQDEHVVFDQVTPEWIAYCCQILKFEMPAWAPATGPSSPGSMPQNE